jgi:hypothetical protein
MQFDRRFVRKPRSSSSIINGIKALHLPALPEGSYVGPIITGFAGALGTIAVFVVGLLLDLLASSFRSIEMREFARHLKYHAHWLIKLVEAHKEYCGTDYESIQRVPPGSLIYRF